jgi:chromosome segregation ATPase
MNSRKRGNADSTSDDPSAPCDDDTTAALHARIAELEAFKLHHQRVWGALSVDEVALFAKTERALLEQNPGGFLSKLHDALFSRKAVEDAKAKHRAEMDVMLERVRLAEAGLPQMREELAKAQRLLSDQTQLQTQQCRALEERLAIAQQDLQRCDSNWRHTGQQKDALEAQVRALEAEKVANAAETARLTAEVALLRADDKWERLDAEHKAKMCALEAECEARRKADVEAVAASLHEWLKTRGRC